MQPAVASVLGYIAGMFVSFLGHSRFTFQVGRNTFGQLGRFCFPSVCGILLSYWCVQYATEYLQIEPVWGTVATAILIPLMSFFVMKFWVFSPSRH